MFKQFYNIPPTPRVSALEKSNWTPEVLQMRKIGALETLDAAKAYLDDEIY